MIRIGDFSRLGRVTVKTLRYYDEVDLLKPVHVDAQTGYRYYVHEQYARLRMIVALKDLGFSLEQIRRLLARDLPPSEMRAELLAQRVDAERRLGQEQDRLTRIDRWVARLEGAFPLANYEVVLKNVPDLKVAAVRGVVPTPPQQGLLWRELETFMEQSNVKVAGSWMALYHDEEYKDEDWDIEVCLPITVDLPNAGKVVVRTVMGGAMASTVHHGPFVTIADAYAAVQTWVSENGYRVVGPLREVGLNAPARQPDLELQAQGIGADQNDPSTRIEIQFPVEKV